MVGVQQIAAAILAELRRQEHEGGNPVRTDGRYADVDGSFDLLKVAEAVSRFIANRTGG